MPRSNPFTVTIYDKAFTKQQVLGSALSYSFTPRFTLGTGEIVTRADDPANQLLAKKGARVVVQYRGEVLMSGIVQTEQGAILPGGQRTWPILDDRTLLAFTQAWIVPGAALTPTSLTDTAQQVPPAGGHASGRSDGSGYYAWPETPAVYPAETAVKKIVADNLARFGSAVAQGRIAIQPDQGRGGDARAAAQLGQVRFGKLQDAVAGLLDWSGLLLRVWQDVGASGLKLDVVAPKTWTQIIGGANRIIADGSYQRSVPSATRVILGGPGEDAARLFYGANDTTGLEDDYGFAVETFVDATGASLHWPDGLTEQAQAACYFLQRTDVPAADKTALSAYLAQAATAALALGRPTAGLDVSLSETTSFHYGGDGSDGTSPGYHVGDLIAVAIEGGPTITQRITECTLAYTASGEGAWSVEPKVGEITEDTTELLARAIAGIATVVGRLITRT